MPSTSKVGSEWVVGREVSKHPPWSIETSTSTACALHQSQLLARDHVRARARRARAPRRSRDRPCGSISSIASVEEYTVEARPAKATSSSRRRSIERSNTNTSACHADRDERRVHADDAAADHEHRCGRHARNAAEQDAAAAERLLEHERAGLRGDLAGDLAHRREQRQAARRRPRRSHRRCRSRPMPSAPARARGSAARCR